MAPLSAPFAFMGHDLSSDHGGSPSGPMVGAWQWGAGFVSVGGGLSVPSYGCTGPI